MRHRADADFWGAYHALPEHVRKQADKAFELLKQNPQHPSLPFKKVGSKWSVRVARKYRALAIEMDDGLLWTWIGSHDDYKKMIQS
jgi:hypothetical protein